MLPSEATRENLRVLHVSDSTSGGGAEAVFTETVEASTRLGHLTRTFVGSAKRNPLSYVFSVANYSRMRNVLNDFQPQVVHLHNYYHFLSPSVLLAIRRHRRRHPDVRIVLTAHDFHLVSPNSGLQRFNRGVRRNYDPRHPAYRLTDKFDDRSWRHSTLKLLQHTVAYRMLDLHNVFDLVLTPSGFLRDTIRHYDSRIQVRVVRNPVDLSPRDRTTRGQGLVYLGRLVPEKGLSEYIEALERGRVSTSFDIYGDGPESKRLQAIADTTEFVKVRLRGQIPRSQVGPTLERYAALAYPSIWLENAPVSIVEAAAAGLAVVVPRGGGCEEMAALSTDWYLFDAEDDESVGAATISALLSPRLNALSNPSQFSASVYMQAIHDVYRDALDLALEPEQTFPPARHETTAE